MRTGTVASTDNRNWELLPAQRSSTPSAASQSRAWRWTWKRHHRRQRLSLPRALRHLLCVSDKPLHGEIKLPGMANTFYRERVDQHLRIGIRAHRARRPAAQPAARSFAEVAFQ